MTMNFMVIFVLECGFIVYFLYNLHIK